MTTFHCSQCNYEFDVAGKVPKKCPYCGKASLRRERTAADLLKEVESIMSDGETREKQPK